MLYWAFSGETKARAKLWMYLPETTLLYADSREAPTQDIPCSSQVRVLYSIPFRLEFSARTQSM